MPGCNATQFAANQCTYHDTWNQIQPPTENINVVGKYTQKFAGTWEGSFQVSYFEGKSQQVSGPDRAFVGGFQGVTSGPGVTPMLVTPLGPTTIPSTNPSFPTGTGLTTGNLTYTFLNLGPLTTETDSKAYRAIADVNGKVAGWDLEFSAGFTEVALSLDGMNYVNPGNLQTALDSTTDPFLVGQQNSAAVNNFVAPLLHTYDTSKLSFGHLGASRQVLTLPGGPLGVAFGADYFQRNQFAVAPADVANGITPNFSNNFTVGLQQVASGYLELVAPELNRQGTPGRFTTGPDERSMSYAITDHLFDLWPGIDYYLFSSFENMQRYMFPMVEAKCRACQGVYLLQEGIANAPDLCDVCDFFARRELTDVG